MESTFDSPSSFCTYFDRLRQRTLRVVNCVPPEHIDWTYREGKFTVGDLIRHLGAIERNMYAENARFQLSQYQGCGKEFADGLPAVIDYLNRMHEESMAIFSSIRMEDWERKTTTPGNAPITLWKWLRAMAEHEIHHRGQLYLYLGLLDVPTPPLFGLTAEEVAARSA